MHELLSTQLPFFDDDELQYKNNIVKKKLSFDDDNFWGDVDDSAKDLVSQLLDKNPATRPNAEEALRHPWLADVDRKSVSKQQYLSLETIEENQLPLSVSSEKLD